MSGVLVDTCVWSQALRNSGAQESLVAAELSRLIDDNQVRIMGAIRQELLSGYSNKQSYEQLRSKLLYFPNEPTLDADYEAAAEYSNLCRSKGIQGSHTDFLICAVVIRAKLKIFTTDKDFENYAKYLPLALHTMN